jgi:hypothetical protein
VTVVQVTEASTAGRTAVDRTLRYLRDESVGRVRLAGRNSNNAMLYKPVPKVNGNGTTAQNGAGD